MQQANSAEPVNSPTTHHTTPLLSIFPSKASSISYVNLPMIQKSSQSNLARAISIPLNSSSKSSSANRASSNTLRNRKRQNNRKNMKLWSSYRKIISTQWSVRLLIPARWKIFPARRRKNLKKRKKKLSISNLSVVRSCLDITRFAKSKSFLLSLRLLWPIGTCCSGLISVITILWSLIMILPIFHPSKRCISTVTTFIRLRSWSSWPNWKIWKTLQFMVILWLQWVTSGCSLLAFCHS